MVTRIQKVLVEFRGHYVARKEKTLAENGGLEVELDPDGVWGI